MHARHHRPPHDHVEQVGFIDDHLIVEEEIDVFKRDRASQMFVVVVAHGTIVSRLHTDRTARHAYMQRSDLTQAHGLDAVALVLRDDEVGAIARRQDVFHQVHFVDPGPDTPRELHALRIGELGVLVEVRL